MTTHEEAFDEFMALKRILSERRQFIVKNEDYWVRLVFGEYPETLDVEIMAKRSTGSLGTQWATYRFPIELIGKIYHWLNTPHIE